ncbi:Ribose ABC transporter periplasmic ribose-binding protein [Pseudomonas viridiflava]|uniref:Ribose ABC transporter periplasmic ribose-binding protein n=6 Tax=Pseudomonas syringae group TaxID=136849 RepID=A0A0Q0AKW6_PSEAJ|nr:Ribose ABC transporter periplasmic ribose-binding protein [Pseudomonas syringae pv. daphniphylli]KPX57063.1 Ribose ABC transporter periplasmic ribose-binding protein [Pseudomonas amygdali pv. hibisci]KPY78079.1 Ribose ABC transporter periplasmic ribose-binding protein [Pseudomonas amygdali pv. tabaci]RMM00727.1 Ribose ABC transporter periplasmic ribose-binding protein [Pseudomonas amygdali pv. eriobotryae]RMO98946.1 Ribose ABC transporter periplasmic ribose-binding protein [Pseudomonas syrin
MRVDALHRPCVVRPNNNHKIGDELMKLPFAGRLLAVAMFAAVTAVMPLSAAYAQTPEKPKVALVMKSLANEFFLTMEDGAKAYQKEHATDFDLISNGIKDESDTSAQIRIVEQMIVSKVDALVIAPADSKALVPVLKKATDAGIKVVNIDNQLDPDVLKSKSLMIPFVGPDNRKGAELVGDYLAKQLKSGDEVGIIEGVPTTTNAQQRTAGFKDAMDKAQMKVVSVQSGNWEIDKGNAVASAMLNEYPNLKALLAGNDSMALGAVSAVRAAGKAGKVMVVGYDNINAIKPMLKDGRVLATADQFAAKQAVFGIEAALKLVKGEKVDTNEKGVIETPVELVTKP